MGDENTRSKGDNDKTALLKADQETIKREIERAKEQDACLILIRGSPQGHRFFITKQEMVIGRDPTVEISIAEQSISRKHARVVRIGNDKQAAIQLIDLGSANGTLVNGKRLTKDVPVVLAKEDMVQLGNSMLKFLPAGELEILYYGNLGSAAHTDSMTKIYNKGYFLEALDAEFKRAKALQGGLSLLFVDLDFFKKINDTYGHEAGDYVLKEFAFLVRSGHLRQKDVFARYGGEEFVLLLTNTGSEEAAQIAEGIRAAIQMHPFIYEGKRIPVTASIGVAEVSTSMESAQALIRLADKALYASKNGGRNRVTIEV